MPQDLSQITRAYPGLALSLFFRTISLPFPIHCHALNHRSITFVIVLHSITVVCLRLLTVGASVFCLLPVPAISSLERKARYLFYFCCFVRFFVSTISRQPAGQIMPNFACGRTLVPNVSSPLLGVGGPRRAEKGEMKFLLLWESTGIFCILAFLSDISPTLARIHTKYYLCRDNVCQRAPSPCGANRPLGSGGGRVKISKNWGWSHSCIGQLPFLFFSAIPNVV